jgi:hypothetical protein
MSRFSQGMIFCDLNLFRKGSPDARMAKIKTRFYRR